MAVGCSMRAKGQWLAALQQKLPKREALAAEESGVLHGAQGEWAGAAAAEAIRCMYH